MEASLLSLHAVASAALKTPELALDPDEAKSFAKALVEVEKQFPTKIDPRMMAVGNLAVIAGMIYLPRFAAIGMRRRQEAEQARRNANPLNGIRSGTADVAQGATVTPGAAAFTSAPAPHDTFVATPAVNFDPNKPF